MTSSQGGDTGREGSISRFAAGVSRAKSEKLKQIWSTGAALGDSPQAQAFLAAVRERNLAKAKELIFAEPGLMGALDRHDMMKSSLHIACEGGDEGMTRFILRQLPHKAPPALTSLMREPLHLAAAGGMVRTALALMDAKHYVKDARDALGLTALHWASQVRAKEGEGAGGLGSESMIARTLMLAGFKAELKTMHRCAVEGEDRRRRFLAGASDNCMHIAARGRCQETLGVMIEAGVDLSRLSASGCTALHACLTPEGAEGQGWGNWGGAAAAGEAAQDFTTTPPGAGEGNVLGCVAALVDAGVGVDTRDGQGRTGLMQAAGMGLFDVVQYLVHEAEADPGLYDAKGRTALMYAVAGGDAKTIGAVRLASSPGTINHKDEVGNTAVHYAVIKNDMACYSACVVPGITQIEVKNTLGQAPLDLSLPGSNLRVAIEHGLLLGCDPALTIQRVWRGHLGRLAVRQRIDGTARRQMKAQYARQSSAGGRSPLVGLGGGGDSKRSVVKLGGSKKKLSTVLLEDGGADVWSTTNLHSVIAEPRVEAYANMYGGPVSTNVYVGNAITKVTSTGPLSRTELLRAFEIRYGSRLLFDRFCTAKCEAPRASLGGRHDGATPPMLGYTAMASLLEYTGLLGRYISRSELVAIFRRRMAPDPTPPGTPHAAVEAKLIQKEMQFRDFRAAMRSLGNRIETRCLRDLSRQMLPPSPSSSSSTREAHALHASAGLRSSSAASSMTWELEFDLPPPPFAWFSSSAGSVTPVHHPSDFLPTVTGMGTSRLSTKASSRTGKPTSPPQQLPPRATTTSPTLTDAYKTFCDLSPTKVRVYPGDASVSAASSSQMQRHLGEEGDATLDPSRTKKGKGKTKKRGFTPGKKHHAEAEPMRLRDRDAMEEGECIEVAAELAQQHSRVGIHALSVEALRTKIFATRNMRKWGAFGCSRTTRDSKPRRPHVPAPPPVLRLVTRPHPRRGATRSTCLQPAWPRPSTT